MDSKENKYHAIAFLDHCMQKNELTDEDKEIIMKIDSASDLIFSPNEQRKYSEFMKTATKLF